MGDGVVVGKQHLFSIQKEICPVAGRWGKKKKEVRSKVRRKE